MYLEYKIYTHINPPESGEHYFNILTANYSSAEYNKKGLLIFLQSVETLEGETSDTDLNHKTWDKLHEDWQEVYDKQTEDIYEKYLKKREFLFNVIKELIIWFKDHNVKYKDYKRKEFVCSSDYRTILRHAKKYYPTPQQTQIIQMLHENYINGTPDIAGYNLVRSIDYYTNLNTIPSLRELFRTDDNSKKMYDDLITKGHRRDTFRLKM